MAVIPNMVAARAAPSSTANDSNAAYILTITGVFAGISILVVFLRMMVRIFMLKSVGLDDWIMLLALTCSVAVLACFIGETQHGLGHHNADVPLNELSKYLHWTYFHSLIVMFGISFVKISVGCFLRRFMKTKKQKTFLLCAIIFLCAFTIACAGTLIFSCVPPSASWDFEKKKTAKCFSINTFRDIGIFNSSVNIFTDVLFAVMPIPIVWKLQVNMRTKFTLGFILALGFFACFAGGIKISKQLTVLSDPNSMWNPMFQIWNYIELNIGILAASLPVLRPLFATVLEKSHRFITGTGRSSGSNTRYGPHSAQYIHEKNRQSRSSRQLYQRHPDFDDELGNDALKLGVLSHVADVSGGADKMDRKSHRSGSRTPYESQASTWLDENDSITERPLGEGEILKTTEVNVHAL